MYFQSFKFQQISWLMKWWNILIIQYNQPLSPLFSGKGPFGFVLLLNSSVFHSTYTGINWQFDPQTPPAPYLQWTIFEGPPKDWWTRTWVPSSHPKWTSPTSNRGKLNGLPLAVTSYLSPVTLQLPHLIVIVNFIAQNLQEIYNSKC